VKSGTPNLYFLAGVTASGKSAMALEWAERNEAEILSCDSVALYRGMDIGSAKPNHEEQTRVKHHGLDLANVDQRYDVSQYNKYAEAIIEEVYQRKGKVLVVGGSGFYLRSFFSAVVDEVMVSNEIKNSVEELYQLEGLDGLIEKLNNLNPSGLGKLDNLNPVRVIKALERCMATGSTLLELKVEFEKKPTPYCNFQKKTCLVDRGDEEIENLIKLRTQSMLANGLIEEVEGLIDRGLLHNYPASSSVGYREILSYLRGELSRDEIGPAIALSTRQLVSKQRKWFRKYYQADQILIPTGGEPLNLEDLIWHSDT
jgi:tRNA dimethylallyltransferase